MKRFTLSRTLVSVVAALALLGVSASSASAWTDVNDETKVVESSSYSTWRFAAWLQPHIWSNPRGGDHPNTVWPTDWLMQSAHAMYLQGGAIVNVCVDVHLDGMEGPSIGVQCGNNGAVTANLRAYDWRRKYVFVYNNSGTAHTISGGWIECNYPNHTPPNPCT
jgi:hypothetical protein